MSKIKNFSFWDIPTVYLPYLRLQHAPQFPKGYVLDTLQMPDGPQHARRQTPESTCLVASLGKAQA